MRLQAAAPAAFFAAAIILLTCTPQQTNASRKYKTNFIYILVCYYVWMCYAVNYKISFYNETYAINFSTELIQRTLTHIICGKCWW